MSFYVEGATFQDGCLHVSLMPYVTDLKMLSLNKSGSESRAKIGLINIEELTNKLRNMRDELAEVVVEDSSEEDDEETNKKTCQIQKMPLNFVIDTKPGDRSSPLPRQKSEEIVSNRTSNKFSNSDEQAEASSSQKPTKATPVLEPGINLQDTYLHCEPDVELSKLSAKELATQFCKEDKLLVKSVIKPGFEQQDVLPPYKVTEKKLKKDRKVERSKTKGDKWFNMPATELTEERKNDLSILQMRSALDPKRFYKKNDLSVLPKYFQIGTVVDSPADFYHARIPKKERKRTMVEELLNDVEFRKYNKRKFNFIQQANSRVRKPFKTKKRKTQD